MKSVGTGLGAGHVRMGCILGLRVSPNHRRIGIGSRLVKSVEHWTIKHGAKYIFIASEEDNVASINLFIHKFDYKKLSSLSIIVQPIEVNSKKTSFHNIKIEKLTTEHAISLYKDRLGGSILFPLDLKSILNEQLSLGTWVSYFNEDHWNGDEDFISKTPSSWAIVSIWKTYDSYKLQLGGATLFRFFRKLLPCFNMFPYFDLPFGFLFLYGLHGEGERVGELIRSLWNFASDLGGTLRECKAIVTELGVDDPVKNDIPCLSSTSCIEDVWLLKRIGRHDTDEDENVQCVRPLSYVFVDPMDF